MTGRRSVRNAAHVAIFVGVALAAGSAAAEDVPSTTASTTASEPASARARYQAGVSAFASGHYADAIILFLDANRVAPSAALSFDVARSYDELGDTSNALAWYRDYLRRVQGAKEREDVEESHIKPLERLLAETGVQQVTVLSVPGGARVTVDGIGVGSAPWTGNLSPGEHRVSARLEGFVGVDRRFVVSPRHASDVSISLTSSSPVHARDPLLLSAPAPRRVNAGSHGSTLRTAGWMTVGAGAASLGGALVFELLRQSAEGAAKTDPTQLGYDRDRTTMENRQLTARVLAGTGGALAVTGVVLVLAAGTDSGAPSADVALDCSTTRLGARLRGRF